MWGTRLNEKEGACLHGSDEALLLWIILHCIDIWSVKKETSWKQGNLLKPVPQSKTEKKNLKCYK